MTAPRTPGEAHPEEHVEQLEDLNELEEEVGIPTDLQHPRAPGGKVVKNPRGEERPSSPDQPRNDSAVG